MSKPPVVVKSVPVKKVVSCPPKPITVVIPELPPKKKNRTLKDLQHRELQLELSLQECRKQAFLCNRSVEICHEELEKDNK